VGVKKMNGYAEKIIYINLDNEDISLKPLDLDFAREYIGGLGFSSKIYFDLIKNNPDFDAFSSENPFIIMTGPLTGIKLNAVARWTVCSKSPLTGSFGDSNIGGFFGAELKFAGYDGIVITGKSEKPSYIYIDDDIIEIREAEKYWGTDTYFANDKIIEDNKEENKKKGQVLTIGPAGENLVKFSSLVNKKGHIAGRTGMGAVFGSKNLKAVFVRGTKKIEPAHPEKLKEIKKELKEVYQESITAESLKAFGTASHMDVGIISGDIPMKNWQQSEWEDFDEIGPLEYENKMLTGKKTCYACSVMCKREAEVKEGEFKFEKGPGPEYETLASFGTLCLNKDIRSIGKANDICNRFGMDTITCGATIAFAIECFENGLITEKDTDGIKLSWGNSKAIVDMVEKIGKREGFGEILSLGSQKAAEHIGGAAKNFLTTVKGLEAPMHDHRSAHGYALAYAVSPRGACHMASLNYLLEGGGMYLPEFDETADNIEAMTSEGKAHINVIAQDFGMVFSNCAIFCNLGAGMVLNATQTLNIINSVTGFNYNLDELLYLGKRIWYLKRHISNIFGMRKEDDMLPSRLMTPLSEGPTQDSISDIKLMLKEFYSLRRLNPDGTIKEEVLKKLKLL
jgi:aldehyde:ferredoxin oxidoreductase